MFPEKVSAQWLRPNSAYCIGCVRIALIALSHIINRAGLIDISYADSF